MIAEMKIQPSEIERMTLSKMEFYARILLDHQKRMNRLYKEAQRG